MKKNFQYKNCVLIYFPFGCLSNFKFSCYKVFLLFLFIFQFALVSQSPDLNNRFMLAQSYEQMGDFEKAKTLYEELFKIQPFNISFFNSLNKIYLQLKEYEKSIEIISKRINDTPDDINLIGNLGITYHLMKKENLAYKVWDEFLQKNDNIPNYRAISNYALEVRDFDKAIEILKKGKKFSDYTKVFSFDLAYLYSLKMNFKEAAEEYCAIIDAEPFQYQNIESRILSYISKPDALPITIKILEEKNYKKNISFAYLLSTLYIENKEFDKAFELHKWIDEKQSKQGNELLALGNKIFQLNNFESASKIYEFILETYPNSSITSFAKIGYCKTTEAILENDFNAVNSIWKPFSNTVIIKKEEYQKLINKYFEVINFYPMSEAAIESYFRIGSIYFEKLLNYDEAEKNFYVVTDKFLMSKFYPEVLLKLSDLNLQKNNLINSVNYLEQLIASARANGEQKNSAKIKKAAIHFYKGEFDDCKKIISDLTEKLNDNSANDALELSLIFGSAFNDSLTLLKFAQAELLIQQKRFSEASVIFEELSKNEKLVVIKELSELRIFECSIAVNNYDSISSFTKKLIDENEKNVFSDKGLFLAAQVYQYELKNFEEAKKIYEIILAKFSSSLYLEKAREEILKINNKAS